MAVWLVRAGRRGEREETNLAYDVIAVGWGGLGDLRGVISREDLASRLRAAEPDKEAATLRNWTVQLWGFLDRMQPGDYVLLPLKGQAAIAIGEVTGPYQFRPDLPADCEQTRPVRWLRRTVPRSDLPDSVRAIFFSPASVMHLRSPTADAEVRALVG